jgi:hypothetical protein
MDNIWEKAHEGRLIAGSFGNKKDVVRSAKEREKRKTKEYWAGWFVSDAVVMKGIKYSRGGMWTSRSGLIFFFVFLALFFLFSFFVSFFI